MEDPQSRSDLVPGTLEMLILKTLMRGPLHGYDIAQRIQDGSKDVLHVEQGTMYPALQRMLMKDWVTAELAQSEHNGEARLYKLTLLGKKQLGVEVAEFRRMTRAIESVLGPGEG